MHPDGYYLAFSGGKDSQVIYQLAKMGGGKVYSSLPCHNGRSAGTVRFIQAGNIRGAYRTAGNDYVETDCPKRVPAYKKGTLLLFGIKKNGAARDVL